MSGSLAPLYIVLILWTILALAGVAGAGFLAYVSYAMGAYGMAACFAAAGLFVFYVWLRVDITDVTFIRENKP